MIDNVRMKVIYEDARGKVQVFLSRIINSRTKNKARFVVIMHKNLSRRNDRNWKLNISGSRSKIGYVNTETRFITSIRIRDQKHAEILGSEERRRT